MTRYTRLSPLLRFKRETEAALAASRLESVIFRVDIFMDIAFAMMGSDLPLRGADCVTVLRPFAFAQRHFSRIRDSIEKKGVALIPGEGTTPHAFICIENTAEFLARAAV